MNTSNLPVLKNIEPCSIWRTRIEHWLILWRWWRYSGARWAFYLISFASSYVAFFSAVFSSRSQIYLVCAPQKFHIRYAIYNAWQYMSTAGLEGRITNTCGLWMGPWQCEIVWHSACCSMAGPGSMSNGLSAGDQSWNRYWIEHVWEVLMRAHISTSLSRFMRCVKPNNGNIETAMH